MTATLSAPARRAAIATVVRAFLDHLAVERGAAANTLGSYRRDLTRYQEFLAGCQISSITDVFPVQRAPIRTLRPFESSRSMP